MTIIVCLGETPETWWQAKNMTGELVLDRAASFAVDDDVRTALFEGKIFQSLDLHDMEPVLKDRAWRAVEQGARALVAEARADPEGSASEWIAHVDELARELEARRLDPDRPGAW